MADLVTMPKMGFDMAEGMLVEWVKHVGDQVAEGDVLAIIETDKANVEVTAFRAGTLRQTLVEPGAMVPVGKAIAVVGTADEDINLADLGLLAAPAQAKTATSEAHPPVEPHASAAGQPDRATDVEGRILASPVARRMAEELGIDLASVPGSGPRGRIVKRDVAAHVQRGTRETPASTPVLPYAPSPQMGDGEFLSEPLSPMRRTIARRMTESKQQAPHFYVTMDVDMAAAMALRSQLNQVASDEDKTSVTDLIVKACALVLSRFPRINASFAGDEIRISQHINIGLAVALERGLITTVLKHCDRKPLLQISREARESVERARQGHMSADDMVGGTFTISNLGMYGVEEFSAIINPPQAAILAVGGVRQAAVVDADGKLSVGVRMKITLSADHRVTDGAEAASFLGELKGILEQPVRLLL